MAGPQAAHHGSVAMAGTYLLLFVLGAVTSNLREETVRAGSSAAGSHGGLWGPPSKPGVNARSWNQTWCEEQPVHAGWSRQGRIN